jgi:hypothetical protein
MTKIKLNDLKKTGKELNDLLFDPSEKEEGWIDVKKSEAELIDLIYEASKLLTEDDELSELAESVVETIKENKEEEEETEKKKAKKPSNKTKKVKKEEEEETDDAVEALIEEIEEADLDDLKDLVKEEDVFKSLRKSIGIQRNADKLRTRMLEVLNSQEEEKETEKEKPAKKEKKPAKKEGKKKTTRMISVCDAIKELPKKGLSIDDLADKANEIFMEQGGQDNPDQTKNILKVISPVLIQFNLVTIEDDVFKPV